MVHLAQTQTLLVYLPNQGNQFLIPWFFPLSEASLTPQIVEKISEDSEVDVEVYQLIVL